MKYSTLFITTLLIAQISAAQSIEGKVFDKQTGEPLPFANVILFEDSIQIGRMTTSVEGEYFFHIAPDTYDVEAVYVGYLLGRINEVVVTEGTTKADIEMEIDENGVDLSEININNLNIKLIRRDETLNGETFPKTNQGIIQGKVFDEKTNEGLPFAYVILLQEGIQKAGTTTDIDGSYIFEKIEQGKYDVEAAYKNHLNHRITGILIDENAIPLDISMRCCLEPVRLDNPHFSFFNWQDSPTTGATWKANEIKRFPGF